MDKTNAIIELNKLLRSIRFCTTATGKLAYNTPGVLQENNDFWEQMQPIN